MKFLSLPPQTLGSVLSPSGRKHRMGIDCVEVSTAFSGDAMIAMLGVLERDVPALSF